MEIMTKDDDLMSPPSVEMTPLKVQMLLHYATCVSQVPNRENVSQREAIVDFLLAGLVRRLDDKSIRVSREVLVNEVIDVIGNPEALHPYVRAVLAIQLPMQKWYIPKTD